MYEIEGSELLERVVPVDTFERLHCTMLCLPFIHYLRYLSIFFYVEHHHYDTVYISLVTRSIRFMLIANSYLELDLYIHFYTYILHLTVNKAWTHECNTNVL
jgi:hypothetical protein